MGTTKQEQPVTDQDKFVRGLYRNIGELARAVTHLANSITVAFPPKMDFDQIRKVAVQENLPGIAPDDTSGLPSGLCWVNDPGVPYKPGDIAKQIAETWKPRIWGSTVKFYDEAWRIFGSKPFILSDLFNHREKLTAATYDKVHLASFQRVLSALVAAGAARRARTVYTLIEPNEDRRMAVERARSKRKEVAA